MNRVIAAAALAVGVWGVKRWLDHRYVQIAPAQHHQDETWENEGGALSPHAIGALSTDAAGLETSQVAR